MELDDWGYILRIHQIGLAHEAGPLTPFPFPS